MLKIFYMLQPFMEDNYRRISVREYARMMNLSPPSASTMLKDLQQEGLLLMEKERQHHFFTANRTNAIFTGLQRLYYQQKLGPLLKYMSSQFITPTIILFGSLVKGEVTKNSDIDIALFSPTKKQVDLALYEKKLKRPIQLLRFKNREEVKNRELLHNILNGTMMAGGW